MHIYSGEGPTSFGPISFKGTVYASLLLVLLMWIMVGTSFVAATLRYCLRSQVDFVPSNEIARDPASRFRLLTKHRSGRPKLAAHTKQFVCSYFLSASLCGLWLGQVLLEHLSGIVLVPSIMRLPHSAQIRPVGRDLMMYLQSG